MTRYALRRIGVVLLICLAIVFFCSLGLRMMRHPLTRVSSGDWFALLRYSLQDTVTYLRNLLTGNLGSYWRASGRSRVAVPVTTVLMETYFKSLGLLLAALAVASVLGACLGALSAYWEGTAASVGLLAVSLLGVSMPTFFAALVLQVAEIMWYQRTGMRLVPVGGFGWDSHIVLPALVLATRPMAQVARITSVAMTEASHQDYVRTAWAKGIPPGRVWADHVLPNAVVPILTAVGVSFRFSLGSLPVVEYFFGWPGLGAALLTAIRGRHASLVITLALALALTFMVTNLLLELAYRLLDPRLRQAQ